MPMSLAEARSLLLRLSGLARRTVSSLRARGWRATWARIRIRLRPPPAPVSAPLELPAPQPFAPFAVPSSDAPLASIVIPVYNHCRHTLACLRALAAHPPAAACEILVVDDGSSDETAAWMAAIAGLRYHRRAANGGFIETCNDGARLARGDYLVLLNNDTVPQPGWLDALLATFRQRPGAGIVGAQLLYPDGRLQEAGGVLFADGSAWSYGRFESPDDPRYACLQAADYVSGAALAIPRALFAALGGFDTRYRPAYYEDTDLAFAVRAAGHAVLVQPAARVVHDEGTSHGTDTGSGLKAYQVRNRAVFAAKWRAALAAFPAPGSVPSPALRHRHQRQVLVLDEAVPQVDRDSASLRLFNLIRLLQSEGAHVVFVPTAREHGGRHTRALQAIGVEVWYAPWLKGLGPWLREHGPRFAVAMTVRHHVTAECLPLLRRYAPQARRVFDTVDLHYLRERRGAELAGDEAALRAALQTRQRELALMRQVDCTLLVSDAERRQLAQDAPGVATALVSNLHEPAGGGLPWAQRRDLVFVGGFGHPPNVDALDWFTAEVLPRIRAAAPDIRLHCIGAGTPPQALGERLRADPGVVLHGQVADLAPWMDRVRVCVAPLRFGAGVKGKINLSMAHGQPVVATTCAAEGMHLHDGEDVLVTDTAEAFATAVLRLYGDEVPWQRLAAGGRANVLRYFSPEAARTTVRRVFFDT